MRKTLPFFSYVCHPLFMPLFGVLFFLYFTQNFLIPPEKFLVVIQVLILTVLIPVAFFFLLRSLGKMDSMMAREIHQRSVPLFAQAVLLFLLVRQSITSDRIPELHVFFLACLASTIAAFIFSYAKVKVSLHMMGMAGMLFFVMVTSYHNQANYLAWIAVLSLATGFVAASRLYMDAHNYRELALGFLCGMVPQLAVAFLL